jgi:hypothetical protein
MRVLTAAALSAALLSSCSTIVNGSSDNVSVTSDPEGAKCVIGGQTFRTPASIPVKHSSDATLVSCSKDGYEMGAAPLQSSTSAWVIGDLFMPWLLSFGIDFITGNAWVYNDSVHITLDRSAAANAGTSGTPGT